MRFVQFAIVTASVALGLLACAEGSPDIERSGAPAHPVSNGASCANHCGESSEDQSCYCDDQCSTTGDCCSDFEDACGSPSNGGGGSGGSGSGGSGGGAPSGGGGSSSGGASSGGASGSGGSGAGGGSGGGCTAVLCNTEQWGFEGSNPCFCDTTCAGEGDCCSNKVAVCG